MNILLVNHYAGSARHGMEYRPYYLGRHWHAAGHAVRVMAASFSHVRTEQIQTSGGITAEDIDGLSYRWYRTPPYAGNGVRRVANIFSFVGRLWREVTQLVREFEPDLVIASSTYPLDIYPCARIARRAGAKLVFEVHDLWPLSPIELGGMSRRHPFIALLQHAEDYACRHADYVVSMLPLAKAYLESRGMAPAKFLHVPNGVELSEWTQAAAALPALVSARIEELRAAERFLVGYAGAHGVANALHQFIDSARQLDGADAVLVLAGQGPEKPALEEQVRQLGLSNVVFLPPVPRAAVPALLGAMDALYIGLQRQPLFRFGVSPNKLMDYMMAGKPVIQAIDAGNDLVAEAGCGVSVPPEDPQAIAEAVRRLMGLDPKESLAMGGRGRSFVARHHAYPVLARRFLAAVSAP